MSPRRIYSNEDAKLELRGHYHGHRPGKSEKKHTVPSTITRFYDGMDEDAMPFSTTTSRSLMTVAPANNEAGFGKAGFNIPVPQPSATRTTTGEPEDASGARVTFNGTGTKSSITPSPEPKSGDGDEDDNGGMSDNDDDNRGRYSGSNGSQGRGGNGSGNNRNSKSNQPPNFSNSEIFNPDPTCQNINENDGRLQYTGAWILESKDPKGLQFTSHTTTTANSQVSFTFNATSVTVIGVVHASNGTTKPAFASYTIDSLPPIKLPLPFTTRDIPNQAFFESEELPLGNHKLVINVTSDGSPYTLNGLKICSRSSGIAAASGQPPERSASHLDIPVLVGTIIGGVVLLALIVFAYMFWCRRRGNGSGKGPFMGGRVMSWLQRRGTATAQFTSTESIMRNNPTNPSTLDAYDKASQVERQVDPLTVPSPPPPRRSILFRSQPPTPLSLNSNPYTPFLPLPAPALLVKNPDRISGMAYSITSAGTTDHLLGSHSRPDAHLSLPPHPPLPRHSVGQAI